MKPAAWNKPVWIAMLAAAASVGSLPAQTATPERPAVSANSAQEEPPSLSQALAAYFPVGAAVSPNDVNGPHAEILKRHFNSIVAENDMKWARIHPAESTFDFSRADTLVAFARSNHMLVRGHTLLWHKQNPPWLFLDAQGKQMQPTPENKALLLGRLEKHIRAVVSRYRDDVYAWDVVNEVIDPSAPDGMRRTPWYLITGTDYIDTAFRTAREVAPKAKLFVNDYDTTDPVKRQYLYDLVRDLKRRGVPVDGVGHQMHINIDCPSTADFVETINMFAALGVDQQVTELDMSVYHNGQDSYATVHPEAMAKQAQRYRELFDALRQLKGKITGVTFWGVADDHTWLTHFPATRLDWPLLFDAQLKPKAAFWGIVDPRRLSHSDDAAGLGAGQ
jgi:endo-1,4-beta-xylanase